MSILCNNCNNEMHEGTVISCPSCNSLICEDCAKSNSMLCPRCMEEIYYNS